MRVLLLLSSIIVAFLSIAFKDTIITKIEPLTTSFYNTNTTTFKDLPLLLPRALYVSNKRANMTIPRVIRKAFLAVEQSEGAGARVRRSIGTPQLRNFSPFLMLDHFTIKPGAGFPDHPHRGQETITYLLEGAVDHEDFAGNAGTIEAGDLQFMTAGKGIMHAEMPRQNPDGSANIGMQLWVDLPEKLKKCEPRYRDLRAKEIPNIDIDDGKVHIKIISGQSHGVDSVKELAYTPVWILDIEIKPGGKIVQNLPEGWNAFAYTLSGSTAFGVGKDKTTIGQYHNVVFEQKGDEVNAEVAEDAKENGHFSKSCDFPPSRLLTKQKFVILRQYPSGELSSNIKEGSISPGDPIPEKDLTKNSPEGLPFLKCLNKSMLPLLRL
jgi:quercetin 2,3-dioxygenase